MQTERSHPDWLLDHVRRKFIEATQATPSVAKGKSKPGASKADVALGYIGKLYAIEREQKEHSDAERYQARQTRSVPLSPGVRIVVA